MKHIILAQNKFKQDKKIIENILMTYGFKEIMHNIYIGNLTKEEKDNIHLELKQNTKNQNTQIIMPICNGCYNNIIQIGTTKDLEDQKYVIL
jgi:CRISPR/Cas system-associated endoribonuclease Cas2